MAGIFLSRGMTLRVPAGGLVLGTGEAQSTITSLTLHVRFDVCPTWIELALKHSNEARLARVAREQAWLEEDEEKKATAIELEFEFSMQAMMSSAIAIDAFYSVIVQHVYIEDSVTEKWRTKRTPRYAQVSEVLRRAFHLKTAPASALRKNLKEIYRVRDMAVHPSGKVEAPVLHPELKVGVEWRFAYFRSENATLVSDVASWTIWELAKHGTPNDHDIQQYLGLLNERLDRIFPTGHPWAAMDGEIDP